MLNQRHNRENRSTILSNKQMQKTHSSPQIGAIINIKGVSDHHSNVRTIDHTIGQDINM